MRSKKKSLASATNLADWFRPDGSPRYLRFRGDTETGMIAILHVVGGLNTGIRLKHVSFDDAYVQAVEALLRHFRKQRDVALREALLMAQPAFLKRYRLQRQTVTTVKVVQR